MTNPYDDDDGDPITMALDEIVADANKAHELACKGEWSRVLNMAKELQATAKHLATMAQDRIE